MARHVPKFGNWVNEENIPYTVYFDKAREGRNGNIKNPNDPQENTNLNAKISPPQVQSKPPPPQVQSKFPQPKLVIPQKEPIVRGQVRTTHERKKGRENLEEPIIRGQVRTTHERKKSRENGEVRKLSEPPTRNENVNRRRDWPTRRSYGSELSVENSPLHPKYKAKVAPKVGDWSPSQDVKSPNESIYGTPRRTRDGPVNKGCRTPGKGVAIPKFGSWDEKDTSSAAGGYTQIFNRKREERLTGTIKSPKRVHEPTYPPRRKYHDDDDDMKSCCFPWGRK